MKKFNLFLITYKFLIINSFIILYFITNFFDGNRGYFSFQKKKIEYDKLTNVEKLLNMENKKLVNELIQNDFNHNNLLKEIKHLEDSNFLDKFLFGYKKLREVVGNKNASDKVKENIIKSL